MLVGGEAGAGKSALVSAFLDRVAVPIAAGSCNGTSTPRPLGPVIEIAAQLEVDVTLARDDLFSGILAALGQRATRRPHRGHALDRRRERRLPALRRAPPRADPHLAAGDLPRRRDRLQPGADQAGRRAHPVECDAAPVGRPAVRDRRGGDGQWVGARPGRGLRPDGGQRLLRERDDLGEVESPGHGARRRTRPRGNAFRLGATCAGRRCRARGALRRRRPDRRGGRGRTGGGSVHRARPPRVVL